MPRALVLDGRTLSSLAIARSLGTRGYSVDSGETFRGNLTSFSKYVDRFVRYPDAGELPEACYHSIVSALHEREYDLLLATRDDTTRLLSEYREELAELTNLFVAPPGVMDQFLDKGETIKLAREVGIPTPRTYFPEVSSLEEIKAEAVFPVLIRPRRSSGSRGIARVETASDFDEAYERVEAGYGTPIVQEFIEKSGYTTACVLLDENCEAVAEFSYERIKEYPLSGGPTVVGVSTDDALAKDYAVELLQAGEWVGPAEVEFILDQKGTPRLLEVNPRFWMPLQLAVSAGVDFPWYTTQLAKGEAVDSVDRCETGLTYRWVLPNEMLHAFSSGEITTGMNDIVESRWQKTCYGIISTTDPLPVVGTVIQSLAYLLDSEKRTSVLNRGQ